MKQALVALTALVRPSHVHAFARGALGRHLAVAEYPTHLAGAMAWLRHATLPDAQGVSYGYDLRRGYLPAYPETTGYIIQTFCDYAVRTRDPEWAACARNLSDWEVSIQMPTGAVQSGLLQPGTAQSPAVFNTGQVMLGWARIYLDTGDQRARDAMARAAGWLVEVMDADGCWRTSLSVTALTPEHAYNARSAWALALVGRVLDEPRFVAAARRNIKWVLTQQDNDAWVRHNTFFDTWPSLTHNIAYVMEGLLETGKLLDDPEAIHAAERIAERLLRYYELKHYLPGGFFNGWQPDPRGYRCLPGDAQIAGVWLQFYRLRDDLRYLNAALKLLDAVAATQDLTSANPGIRGGIAGSFPFRGFYSPLTYVNWAAKFFADSLMLAIDCKAELGERIGREDGLVGARSKD